MDSTYHEGDVACIWNIRYTLSNYNKWNPHVVSVMLYVSETLDTFSKEKRRYLTYWMSGVVVFWITVVSHLKYAGTTYCEYHVTCIQNVITQRITTNGVYML